MRPVEPFSILFYLMMVLIIAASHVAANDSDPNSIRNRLIVYVGKDTNGQAQIFTIRPDGRNQRQLTQTPGGNSFPAWSQDGRKIIFTSGRTGTPELWVMDANGSDQIQLTAPPASGNFVPSWSPDGRQILFETNRNGPVETWIMDADGNNQKRLFPFPYGAGRLPWQPRTDFAQWEPDQRLTIDPGASQLSFNFARSVAADDFGRVHVVWYDTRDGNPQIYYKHSPNGGATWGPDTRLSEHPAGGEHPTIAVSGADVYVTWHDMRNGNLDIFLKHSTDGGNSWGPDIPLTTHPANSAHPSIAASGSSVHVVWVDNRDGQEEIYTRHSPDEGETWNSEIRLSDLPFASWVPTVSAYGQKVYVAWVDTLDGNEEEYFRNSMDGGMTWGPVTRLTYNPADSWAPSIAASKNTVYLTWFDRRDAGILHTDIERKLDEVMVLIGLLPEPAPPSDPTVYYLPGFMQRLQEKLLKIQMAAPGWVQSGGDPRQLEALLQQFQQIMQSWEQGWEIYYKFSSDSGMTWGPDIRLTYAPGLSVRPSMAVLGHHLHIAWFDSRDGNAEIYYKHSSDGGTTWGPDTRLTYAPGDSMHSSIAVSDELVHVVWFDQRDGNFEIYHKRTVKQD